MFVKKSFLANLHSPISKILIYVFKDLKKLLFLFLHARVKNTQKFTRISNSWNNLKKWHLEKVICKLAV
jgi:hypothetical protein